MFTGIIEELGRIERLERRAQGGKLVVAARRVLEGTRCGDSIAVNGVCLTAASLDSERFSADMSEETLSRSTLGSVRPGTPVNLERALALGQRMGGHVVQGHVDGTGEFLGRRSVGESVMMRFRFPAESARYIALKGSVAVDGVSLTVAELGRDWFEIAVVPTTLSLTNLAGLRSGDRVNLETDVLAKYLERLLEGRAGIGPRHTPATDRPLTAAKLRELGY